MLAMDCQSCKDNNSPSSLFIWLPLDAPKNNTCYAAKLLITLEEMTN
jgi:hypothetical protein